MTDLRIYLALFSFVTALALAQEAKSNAGSVSSRARQIHNSAIVVDTHADTPQRFLDENFDVGNADPTDNGHVSLDKARARQQGAELFSIWVESALKGQCPHRALVL